MPIRRASKFMLTFVPILLGVSAIVYFLISLDIVSETRNPWLPVLIYGVPVSLMTYFIVTFFLKKITKVAGKGNETEFDIHNISNEEPHPHAVEKKDD